MLTGCFLLAPMADSELVDIAVVPEVPRADEPIITTFKLNNPTPEVTTIDYSFYANGELLQEGTSTLASHSSKTYQYVYKNPLELGEQVNFVVKGRIAIARHNMREDCLTSTISATANVQLRLFRCLLYIGDGVYGIFHILRKLLRRS